LGTDHIHDHHFVLSIAAMKHGRKTPRGMQGQLDRKVAYRDLPAGGA
jgi:hypothetical protein